MSLSQEFYDYADEHFGWADTAKTEHERAIFSQMAAAWLEVAQPWAVSTASEAVLAPSASWGVLLEETILDLGVDRVQPLLGAFGFLAVRV